MNSVETRDMELKGAGWLLVGSGVLAIFAMAHHPTGADDGIMIRAMHGAIIVIMLVQAIGLLLFVRARADVFSHSGMFVSALALVAGMAAGSINGFIVPAMLENVPVAGQHALYQLLWESNQVLATGGVLLTSLAFGLWAAGLWRGGWWATSALALTAAVIPAGALLSGQVTMDLTGALFCYAVQAAWIAWLGVMLIRYRD